MNLERKMTNAIRNVLPASAVVTDGELSVGGIRAARLAEEFGTHHHFRRAELCRRAASGSSPSP